MLYSEILSSTAAPSSPPPPPLSCDVLQLTSFHTPYRIYSVLYSHEAEENGIIGTMTTVPLLRQIGNNNNNNSCTDEGGCIVTETPELL